MAQEDSPSENNANDIKLQILLKDYELATNRANQIDSGMYQLLGGGLSVLGIIAGYVINQQSQLPLGITLLAPLSFVVFYSVFLLLYFIDLSEFWHCRIISAQINEIVRETVLIRFIPNYSPSAIVGSLKRGSLRIKLIYVFLFGTSVVLFISLTTVVIQRAYQLHHFGGVVITTVYTLIGSLLLFCFWGVFFDIPRLFETFFRQMQIEGRFPANSEFLLLAYRSMLDRTDAFLAFLFPRPKNFIVNGIVFWYGFLAAWISKGFQQEQLPLVNFLFRGVQDWDITNTPAWAIWCLGFIYFLVQEFLLQQAKHMWDDIRDVNRDKALPHNSDRPIARGVMSIKSAKAHMWIRGILALILGYIIGGFALTSLFLVIILHQIIYVLWGKPNGAKRPVVLLYIIAFNIPLRFVGGALSVLRDSWSYSPFVLIFVLLCFMSLGSMASLWKMEAEYRRDENLDIGIRPQSHFYLSHGTYWQHVGFLSACIAGVIVVAVHQLSRQCNLLQPIAQSWYGLCDANGNIEYYLANTSMALVIIAIAIGVITLTSKTLLFVLLPFRKFLDVMFAYIKAPITFGLLASTVGAFLASLSQRDAIFLFYGLLLLALVNFAMFEKLTYLEYSLYELRKLLAKLSGLGIYTFSHLLTDRSLIFGMRKHESGTMGRCPKQLRLFQNGSTIFRC